MRRRELPDAGERRAGGGDGPGRERLDERRRIELAPCLRVAQQRLGLGREADQRPVLQQEERPDAEAVARQEELAPRVVPDREREVAV